MKGIFNLRTPVPRYTKLWDPEVVLSLLRKWSPAEGISLKLLTIKTLMLMLLVSGQRLDTISKLSLNSMEISGSTYKFETLGLNKQSRSGYRDPVLHFRAFPADRRLCIFRYLTRYLAQTREHLEKFDQLFLTYQKPIHPASKDTLSRWAKIGLKEAGIDTKIFTSHSFRGG